jgi:branched-chain amino acid transport system substrate-binding protein
MRFRTALTLLLAAALPFTGTFASLRAAEPYEIYAILALTGPFAFLGNAEAASLRTIEANVNKSSGIKGQPIHFVVGDDQSNPSVAVQLANGIIAKKASIILGPTYVASCIAVSAIVRANGPVEYCFAPAIHPPPGSYTLSAGVSSVDQSTAMLTFAQFKGWKRLAVITTTDATGQDVAGRFMDAYNSGKYPGVTVVDEEFFAPGDVSVAAQAAKLKASNPDAIVLGTVGAATGTALRSLKDAGLDALPYITNYGNLLHAQLDQYAGFMPGQLYFTAPRFVARDVSPKGPVRDAQLAFYRAFNAQGIDPDVGNNLAWDATLIVVDALRRVGTDATPKALLDEIEQMHGFAGTVGVFDFRDGSQRGVGLNGLVIARWDAAKKTWATVSEPGGKPLAAK